MASQLFAAGLNSHKQLDKRDGTVSEFIVICEDKCKVLLDTWTTLLIETPTQLKASGYSTWHEARTTHLRCVIGSFAGALAALNDKNQVYLRSREGYFLVHAVSDAVVYHMAMSVAGRVACVIQEGPGLDNHTHIKEYSTFEDFRKWVVERVDVHDKYHTIPGKAKQLVAGNGCFAILMHDHTIHTWGDARYRTLGRSTIGKCMTAAEKPGPVDALAGLKFSEIAMGGWMGGAVSSDGTAYLWGSGMPDKQYTIDTLSEIDSAEGASVVTLMTDGSDEPDVVDLAIGHGHAVLATSTGDAYVVGENKHGQLGLNSSKEFISTWTQVKIANVQGVFCGAKQTFLQTGQPLSPYKSEESEHEVDEET